MKQLLASVFVLLMCSTECFSQSHISRQQALEDIDFYNSTLQEVHYNPFLHVEKRKYFTEVDKFKKNLPDSVKLQDFVLSMYRLTSLLEDSHTSPNIVQAVFKEDLKKPQFFPYQLIVEKGKLYVPKTTAEVSPFATGSEIIAINNKEIKPLLKQVQQYIGGIPEYSTEMAKRLLPHYLFLSGIKAPFVVDYLEPSGRKMRRTVKEGIPFIKSLVVTMPGITEKYSFRIIDNKVGYIDFKSMTGDWQEFGRFMDSCVTVFNDNNIEHVAIDLRQNSGGNSMLGDLLLTYFTDKAFTLSGGKKWKVSQQYKDYLVANGNTDHEYLKKENGTVWESGSCEPRNSPFATHNKFTGQVYLLTGAFTFSSANMLANGAKQYKIAELVGEATGENTSDFGEVYTFTLPNSKIVMNTTTSYDIGADCAARKNKPVIPDVLITSTLNDKIQGRDKVIEYLLRQAEKQEVAKGSASGK